MMRIHFYVTNILYRRIHFFINNFKHTIYFLYFSIHFRVLVRVFSVDIYFVTPFLPRGRACFKCHEKVNMSRYTYQSYLLFHKTFKKTFKITQHIAIQLHFANTSKRYVARLTSL